MAIASQTGRADRHRLIVAGLLLGIGLGAFVDGMLFREILQLHGMLSARLPRVDVDAQTALANVETGMLWDGLVSAFAWTTTVLGLVLLWRATQRASAPLPTRTWFGSMALGWGLFDLVEGVLDHHVLQIQHVTESPNHLVWDLAFLAWGCVLAGLGGALIRVPGSDVEAADREPIPRPTPREVTR